MSYCKPLDLIFVKSKTFEWPYCYNQHLCLKSKISLRKTYSIALVINLAAIDSDWKRAIANSPADF